MPTDISGARDDVNTMLTIGLTAALGASTIASIPTVVWDDQTAQIDKPESADTPSPISPSSLWVRAIMRHTSGGQATLQGVPNGTRYRRKGILIFGINAPLGDGQKQADVMASVILGCYEGKSSPNDVWFRNGYPKEIGVMGEFWLTNVQINFEYDTIK